MAAEHQNKQKKQPTDKATNSNNVANIIAGISGVVYSVSPSFQQLTNHTLASISKNGGLESIFENQNTYAEIIERLQQGKQWQGKAVFIDTKQDEYIAQLEVKVLKNGKVEPEISLTFSDIIHSKKNELIETRLLKAISQCTEMLFSDTEAENVVPSVLDTIGKATDADRCYIGKIILENGEMYVIRRFEWVKHPSLNNDAFKLYQKFTYNSLFEILDSLNAGKIVTLHAKSKMSKQTAEVIRHTDIVSLLKIPIFKDNNLWGYIGFEDTCKNREWNSAERKALKSLAQNIGAHIKIHSLTEELLSKNRQLENAIEGSTDGLWAMDYSTHTIYISPRTYKIFGYEPNEWPLSGHEIKNMLKTEDTELLELELTEALKKRLPAFEFETVGKHKSGKYIWLRGNVALTYNKEGRLVKHSGSITDITTEKTFELKIRRQEEHYRRLVNSLKEVVFETDKQGKITFLNNSWKNLTGRSLKESTGKKLASYIEKQFVSLFEESLQQLRDKQSWPGRIEVQIKGKNRTLHWVELWLRGMFDSNYELTGISGSIFDINSKKIATQQLRESEERYRLISENTKDIVCLHDCDGKYLYISPSMYDTLGYPPKALIGVTAWECVHPEDVKELKNAFKLLFKGNQPDFVRYRVRHRKGHYLWVETVGSVQNVTGEKPLIQTATRDIHQQKKAEEEIKNALEKERHLVELRTNLINMISHEFRTPLTSIKSSSDLLLKYLPSLRKSDVKERFSVHFERIRAQVNRINELISGVLVLGRMDTGKIQFLPEPIQLGEFIDEFFVDFYDSHPEDNRKINVSYFGKVREVEVDRLLLTHILRNLVSNALKYSQGSKNPELNIKFEQQTVHFTITDYGIGIAEKDLKNLFQSFYRGDNALTIPGTGLGLVIVKQFVDMHGGEIKLESKLNKGTTIEVTLPI